MQISIDQHEIEQALKQFISDQGISLEGQEVEIEFTTGKKPSGPRATITIIPETDKQPASPEDFPDEPAIPFNFIQEQDED